MVSQVARRGKWISETTYRDIEKIIQHHSQKYINAEGREDLSKQKLTNCETNTNINLIFIHGYTICVAHNDLITWIFKNSWEMLLSEFSQAEKNSMSQDNNLQ